MSEATIHALDLPLSDKGIARDYEIRMRATLDTLCALENEVAAAGFAFTFQIGFNSFGQKSVQSLAVLKKLT